MQPAFFFENYEQGAESAEGKASTKAAEIERLVERIKHPHALLCDGLFSNDALREALFGALFRYKKFARHNYGFCFSASTNGVSASLLFSRLKPAEEEGEGEHKHKRTKTEEEAARKEEEKARKKEATKHYKNFVGIDPGFINVGVAALQEGDEKPKICTITSQHYQHRAGHKANKKRFEQNKEKSPLFRLVCEQSPTMKTSDLGVMAAAIRFHFLLFEDMYQYCSEQKFIKKRFTTWIKTRRAWTWIAKQFVGEEQHGLDPFASSYADKRTARRRKRQAKSHPKHQRHSNPKRKARRKEKRKERRKKERAAKRRKKEERGATLVGIGDFALKGNTRSIIRGHQLAPNQGIRKALLQRPGVVVWDIDEYHTSKMCYQCQSADCEMHKVMLKKKLKKKDLDKLAKEHKEVPKEEAVACYHVLRCNKCRIPVQRDENASLNILRLTRGDREGRARPKYLSRIAPFRDNGGTAENPDQAE